MNRASAERMTAIKRTHLYVGGLCVKTYALGGTLLQTRYTYTLVFNHG